MRQVKKSTVLVFGVFDLFHPGHVYFLKAAAKKGKLIVVVARDKAVRMLKGKKPDHGERRRLKAVQNSPVVTQALLGDAVQGRYSAIKKYKPDIICFGYDQLQLRADIRRRMKEGSLPKMGIVMLKPHRPRRYKTSLMRHKPLAK